MPLQEMYYIAEMVVGVAVIISIVFVAIELRQNTYLTRKSMADQREDRMGWLNQALLLDDEFRIFHQKVITDWDGLNDDEKVRATQLGQQMLTPLLNELVAHFDNHLSPNEFRILKWSLEVVCNRPHMRRAFEFLRPAYPEEVHKFYDDLIKHGRRHITGREASQLLFEK